MPDAHFPRMRVGDRFSHPWQYLRREVPHRWYADDRFPLMGFMNRDEALILHNFALQFAGRPGLEIGGWLGWSTCHLALAGVRLDVIDPAHADPDLRAIVEQSLAVIGGLLGAAATYLIFDGVTASTLGGNFTQVVFDFKLSPWLIAEGVVLALIVGLIGGLFPALRAARLPIVEGLYAN